MPISDDPESFADMLAATVGEGLEFALAKVNAEFGKDVKIEHLLVMLRISGGPPDEADSTTAAFNVEGPEEAFQLALSHVVNAGKEMGLDVRIVPIRGEG